MADELIDEMSDDDDVVEASVEEDLSAFAAEVNVDPGTYVTITTMGGQTRYVPVDGPTSVIDVFSRSGISVQGAFKFFMNGAEVSMQTILPVGSTVSLLGQTVKGG